MKFFHTADWHLGKLVQGVSMTEDQDYVLEQLLRDIERERPDAVIIAGDLYDRAIPPTDAVELLDRVLGRIVLDLETPVLAISGNHDSPDRLGFATRIMEGRGLHLAGQLQAQPRTVELRDAHGPVHIHLVPYADPAMVRFTYGDDRIRTHDDAMAAIVARIAASMDASARHVLVGHAFVTPGGEPQANTSESERPLAIGGAEYVRDAHFRAFHYTALGHLHQAHYVGSETIRYAGSPLKYSISEERHHKGYTLVELDGDGAVRLDKRAFAPRRELRSVQTTAAELEAGADGSEDYVFVTLLDEDPVLFPMEKVRARYPNALHVQRRSPSASPAEEGGEQGLSRAERDPGELFASFYREVKGAPLDAAKAELFASVYAEALRAEGGDGR
ncbi:exonuclease SbcCD subunit D [Paenibacillus sp. IB182496]|uniref:Nuclease SbcCD subunit D n=1 Tax=Paenibacillus sabuli TaxID=2772509 RepID=A0A927BUT7_9BACL|nr:exonuclease SbcCD subunit D [Paenibacillus sabuli]MBD2845783.1 exonuclease SbcCD subunit D [Paenibacillus sabuli]